MKNCFVICIFLILCNVLIAQESKTEFPDAQFGDTVTESISEIKPGVRYTYRVTADPMHIHILELDLTNDAISIKTTLGKDKVQGIETVKSMANRHGALAAINGDYWGPNGVPQGMTIVEGEMVIAPKYRTAFAMTEDGEPVIDNWNDGWSWKSEVIAPNEESHPIVMMNSDCGEGWMCLYTDHWGSVSRGNSVSPVTELVVDENYHVLEVRTDQPGIEIPEDGFILTGRDDAGTWLTENFQVGNHVELNLKSAKPFDHLQNAIGAGPRIIKNGKIYQDPMESIPAGEEFSREWKELHYLERHPRSAIGYNEAKFKLILVTVDGRQPERSIGLYQLQMARLLLDLGATEAMDLDSGGSATMVIQGKVVNIPSDNAEPDGTSSTEREVANALLIMYDEDQ